MHCAVRSPSWVAVTNRGSWKTLLIWKAFPQKIKASLTCHESILGCTTARQHQQCFQKSIKQEKPCYPAWVRCQLVCVSPCSQPVLIFGVNFQLWKGLVREHKKPTNEKLEGPASMKCPAPSCGITSNSTSWSFLGGKFITLVLFSPEETWSL